MNRPANHLVRQLANCGKQIQQTYGIRLNPATKLHTVFFTPLLILGVLLRHEREAEDNDVDGCGGGDNLGSSGDGLTAGLGFPLANRELRKLVRRAPGEMDGLFHLLQIRIHLHGGGFGLNQILAKDVDPESLMSSLPKAVSLLEWAISEEPFENLPNHAYEGIADWERTLIQGRVRALCILEEIYACQPCIQVFL
nr:phosphoglucan phosphatase LSF2, chloroplastic [Ipomoea batatas]